MAGGLHEYLKYDGAIILSLVMPDKMIAKLPFNEIISAIKLLKPDFCTTFDCEGYAGDEYCTEKEIENSLRKTKDMILELPSMKFIGHVKGCSASQIMNHCKGLKSLGIVDFMLHTGDFSRHGDDVMIQKARHYAKLIRKEARHLLLYGTGSPRRFLEFSFADVFITFKHFVMATHGFEMVGNRKVFRPGGFNADLVLKNFMNIKRRIIDIKKQSKLIINGGVCLWEGVLEQEDLPTLHTEVAIET